jgi:hypothetical protein
MSKTSSHTGNSELFYSIVAKYAFLSIQPLRHKLLAPTSKCTKSIFYLLHIAASYAPNSKLPYMQMPQLDLQGSQACGYKDYCILRCDAEMLSPPTSGTQLMEAAAFSKTFAHIYHITQHHILQNHSFITESYCLYLVNVFFYVSCVV